MVLVICGQTKLFRNLDWNKRICCHTTKKNVSTQDFCKAFRFMIYDCPFGNYVHISMLRICQSYLVWFVCLIFCLIWCWEAIHDSSFLTLGSSIAMLQLATMCSSFMDSVQCTAMMWPCGHILILCILSSVQTISSPASAGSTVVHTQLYYIIHGTEVCKVYCHYGHMWPLCAVCRPVMA